MNHLSASEKRAYEEFLEAGRRIKAGTAPPRESEATKRRRVARLLKPENFEEFCKFYFETPDVTLAPFGWFHNEAVENVFIRRMRKHIWEWHREAAKSVFADIFIPIFMLARGELTGMILASENEDKAKNLIKDVENQLRNNLRLINDFGDFHITGTWLQSFFQTGEGIGFWAFGLGQNPAGVRNGFLRPNLGLVDDADNKDKAKNQKLVKERVDWIQGEFMGCLAKDNRCFIYVNNRVHKAGITAHLAGDLEEDDEKDDSFAHVKCYLTEDRITHQPIVPEWGSEAEMLEYLKAASAVPAWKEYYSLEDCVKKIRDYGRSNSLRQLYHKHIIEGNRFTEDMLPWGNMLPLHKYDALVTYCDPAYGESKKGCYRAIVLVGVTGHAFHVIWAWMSKTGSYAAAHYRIAENLDKGEVVFKNQHFGARVKLNVQHWVESGNLQKTVLKMTYKELNATLPDHWMPRFDMDVKGDKVGRIEGLEPLAEQGLLVFNEMMRKDRSMLELREQFKEFPDGMMDGPDAVEGAVSKLRKKKKTSRRDPKGGYYTKNRKRFG